VDYGFFHLDNIIYVNNVCLANVVNDFG